MYFKIEEATYVASSILFEIINLIAIVSTPYFRQFYLEHNHF
jgi:transcriptional regulator of heat shock response